MGVAATVSAMPESLLDRSARLIDEGFAAGAANDFGSTNPVDGTFHEVADRIGMLCAFSHVFALRTEAGHVLFDTSLEAFGPRAVEAIGDWGPDPVDTIVYTHGHLDHVGGARALIEAAESDGRPRPTVIGHEAVPARFERYDRTAGYNTVINRRQFGWDGVFELDWVHPDTTYRHRLDVEIGATAVSLRHDRGETDDHTWAWVPEEGALFTGDLVMWTFPNAGNPQKVQRYAADWAAALRSMLALEPELLLPAHGLPVAGRERIATLLDDCATALEGLVRDTLELMNEGATLDEIIHTVRVPEHLLEKPYLTPNYDEPEFAVRNIWRLNGGWYDGDPARLKPAPAGAIATEVASLSGGALELARRALVLSDQGDHRLACQLAEWAGLAAPTAGEVHRIRAEVYRRRRAEELSLMARGIFGAAVTDSDRIAHQIPDQTVEG
jgi:alkyl sulfatase BDS1-like metallo-beta-lactamase superfamily hydrolase